MKTTVKIDFPYLFAAYHISPILGGNSEASSAKNEGRKAAQFSKVFAAAMGWRGCRSSLQ